MTSEIINKKRQKIRLKKELKSLVFRLAFISLLVFLIFSQVFLLDRVHGDDNFPALKDGDLVLVFRLQSSYDKNDLVSYELDGKRKLGRYIAQEKDKVIMDDSGILLVNSAVQSGEIVYPTYAREGLSYPYEVPEGQVFVLGDYRPQAQDSRDFGAINLDSIEGKVISLFRRRGL